jgi:hypothetical protein
LKPLTLTTFDISITLDRLTDITSILMWGELLYSWSESTGFKASRAIRKAQFTQKRVAYKILLFETTSLKLPNLFKMVSHLLLTVLTNFSRPVRNVTLNVLSMATFVICSFSFRAVKRQFTKEKNENL